MEPVSLPPNGALLGVAAIKPAQMRPGVLTDPRAGIMWVRGNDLLERIAPFFGVGSNLLVTRRRTTLPRNDPEQSATVVGRELNSLC